jgi:hypothetical protein
MTQPISSLTFDTLPPLPIELVLCILHHWIAPQVLTVTQDFIDDNSTALVTYFCATDAAASSLPPLLQTEYWRLRTLSWTHSPKSFSRIDDFCSILSPSPQTLFIYIPRLLSTPILDLQHLVLDFSATQFFAFFNVPIPPFKTHDTPLHAAAGLLHHTHHLSLVFGTAYRFAHAWYDLDGEEWEFAKTVPKVCDAGVVVDWILEAAWDAGFVQRLKNLEVEGEVQMWVKKKWVGIWKEWVVKREGRARNMGWGEVYGGMKGVVGREDVPPKCRCEFGCWELGWSKEPSEFEGIGWGDLMLDSVKPLA